jgi:outer membrane protein
MRMKKFLPLILLGCYFSRTARAQEVWDLKKCVEYAVANNISVKQQDVQARLVGLVYKQYILSQIPTLSFQGNLSYNSGYTQNPQNFKLSTNSLYYNSYNLQSGINIFNFNNLRNNIAGSKLAFEAANATTDNISTAQLQLKFSKASLEITRKLVNAGSVPELNAAELESQVAQDSSAYVTASSNVQTAILTVKAYMSFDAAAGFVLDTPPVDKIPIDSIADLQPADVYALALLNQPLQKADALVIKSQEKYVAASRAAFLPTVSLFGSLGSTYTNQTQEVTGFYTIPPPPGPVGTVKVGANSYDVFSTIPGTGVNFTSQPYFSQLNTAFRQSVGVSLSVPILNGGFAKVGYERAKLNLKNDQLLQQADNLALKQNIFQAYNLAVSALQKFESNKKTVDATQRSFDYAQKRYNIGLLNTIDLLTNQNNYFKAKNDLLYSQFDYVFKMKVLEFYKGMGIRL